MKRFSRRTFMGTAMVSGFAGLGATASDGEKEPWRPVPLENPLNLDDVPTPALLIELDTMERNLTKMTDHLQSKGVRSRPHTKTHKCPIIAHKQLELGAVGVCAAKVSEAEVMVDAGIGDVLITSPVVTTEKIDRVIALAKKSAGVRIVLDNEAVVKDFNDAASAAGLVLNVFIDLDTGTKRTGIAPGKPALELLETIAKCRALSFAGLQAYAGHIMHRKGYDERKAASVETLSRAQETKALMEKAGHEVPALSVGGTGTFDIDSGIEGVTDLQVGSYLFMDQQYRAIGDADGPVFDYFEPALFVLATAISKPVERLITIDTGYKAFATDAMKPEFRELEGLVYHWGGDEHGIIQIQNPSNEPKLGDKMQFMVPHCDPTVNLYDYYFPYRDGAVTELWPVAARGKSQ